MTDGDQPTSRDSRFAIWIGATAGLFVLALAVGFIWLPSAQRGADGLDLWSAICRAVGLPNGNARVSAPVAGQPASTVAWTTETRRRLAQGDATCGGRNRRRPATTATARTGSALTRSFPNLAGQSAAAIYKQLEDFKSGKRDPAVMGVFVSPLSEQNMLDLAAHYASLPNPTGDTLGTQGSTNTVRVPPDRSRRPAPRHSALRGMSWTAWLHALALPDSVASSEPISNCRCRPSRTGLDVTTSVSRCEALPVN